MPSRGKARPKRPHPERPSIAPEARARARSMLMMGMADVMAKAVTAKLDPGVHDAICAEVTCIALLWNTRVLGSLARNGL